jgi:hypothetical protein
VTAGDANPVERCQSSKCIINNFEATRARTRKRISLLFVIAATWRHTEDDV